jgi:hypothetical protein
MNNHHDILIYLLCDLNMFEKELDTALLYLARENHVETMQQLVDTFAECGKSCINANMCEHAAEAGSKDSLEWLLQRKCSWTSSAIVAAVDNKDEVILKLLLQSEEKERGENKQKCQEALDYMYKCGSKKDKIEILQNQLQTM